MTESDKTNFKKAAAGIASTVILETTPPHFHLQFQANKMLHIKYLVYAFLVIVVSCSLLPNLDRPQSYNFNVEKEALGKGLLRIYLPEKTPKSLAIKTPGGE